MKKIHYIIFAAICFAATITPKLLLAQTAEQVVSEEEQT